MYCPYCSTQNNDDASFCVDCGKSLNVNVSNTETHIAPASIPPAYQAIEKPIKKKTKGCAIAFLVFFVLIGAFIALVSIGNNEMKSNGAGVTSISTNTNPSTTTTPKPTVPNLELIGKTTTTTDGVTSYIEGKVKNNTKRNYNYVQISFGIYDEQGNKAGTAFANVSNLGAGETWKFKAMILCTLDSSYTYRLDDLTGY